MFSLKTQLIIVGEELSLYIPAPSSAALFEKKLLYKNAKEDLLTIPLPKLSLNVQFVNNGEQSELRTPKFWFPINAQSFTVTLLE